tara:strand:- start:40 stop:693 length:654 start_codon:yes stop_codon:yes gene_type:complete
MNIQTIDIAGLDVSTSNETDGFGLKTCQEAVNIFYQFSGGRKFDNALECFCGPGYYGLGLWKMGIVKNISFSDIASEAELVMRRTFEDNDIDFPFYLSDNFDNIPKQKFDLIVGNPPHFNVIIPSEDISIVGNHSQHEDRKMQDLDWKVHKKFYKQVGKYLTDDGSIMLMENWNGSSVETFKSMLEENGLQLIKFYSSEDKESRNYYIEVQKKCAII